MRRNLHRGKNVPLLDVHTDDPNPSYLRIAVLNDFNGVEWTSGNRQIVSDQTASGLLPYSEQGLAANVPTDPYNYRVTATKDFDSTWLPTQFPALERDRRRATGTGTARRWTSSPATTRPTPPA